MKPLNSPTAEIYQGGPNMTDCMSYFENLIKPGCEPVMTKEYKPQVAFQLGRHMNPEKLKRHVLQCEKMRLIIAHYARERNCPAQRIERQAKEIIDEIGLDRNLAIIRWCGMTITAIGKRICKGIYVNAASMDAVKRVIGKNPVLYLPSHRSYMDFILMSYICFHYEIEIPGIAAGMDFHSMFAMGEMLRKTGAFFMRRSFSTDELYWDIFREYMYALVASYHIGVEFFIEGTRSRNFKALVPKVGLLSMALLPYFTGEVSDITVVPVSISYERVLEEQLFVYELLGVPKPKESTKGFFKALKILDEHFGSMYVDFGSPISIREFFGHTSADRQLRANVGPFLQKLNKIEIELVKKLANEVIYQQQRRIVITTFNLLSLFYASQLYNNRSCCIEELARGITQLKGLFEQLDAHVSTDMNRLNVEIIETVEIHSAIVHLRQGRLHLTQVAAEQLAAKIDARRLKGFALSPQTMAVAVPALALQLYINPCLFWLARPAFLMLAALEMRHEQIGPSHQNQQSLEKDLFRRVGILDGIFKHEFIIESNRETEEFSRNLKLLKSHGILSIADGQVILNENDSSRIILSALAPFLCMYYQMVLTLNQFSLSAKFTSRDVLVRMQERIEQIIQRTPLHDPIATTTTTRRQQHVHPYCLALDNMTIALNYIVQEGYLARDKESDTIQHFAPDRLKSFENQLLHYCELMPFAQYYDNTTTIPTTAASANAGPSLQMAAKL